MSYVFQHRVADGVRFYGGAREFWRYKGHEVLLSGPFETGKTFAVLTKLHTLLWKYANCRAFITRNTYQSLLSTAIVTYETKVLPVLPDHPDSPIRKYGKSRPEFYEYPNGSHLLVVGLDNPTKLLSGEFDFGYFNQLEEVALNAYELALGRCTGRAGNAPYPQVMGDANPGHPQHWILKRSSIQLYEQLHKHNPVLFDQTMGEWTDQGERTIKILSSLTGLRYKRGYLGQWAGAEGAVYEDYHPERHVIKPFDIPRNWKRYRAIDFGFTNPFVCQWWAEDDDGRLYMYREIYMSQRTVADHAQLINQLSEGERYEFTVADHDREDRETLHQNGIRTINAKKDIVMGIDKVRERLRDDTSDQARPRIFWFQDATYEIDPILIANKRPTSTVDEIPMYVYPDGVDGKPVKEIPIDVDNHGCDAFRYMVMALQGQRAYSPIITNIFKD